MTDRRPIVLANAGASFPNIEPERKALAHIDAEVIDVGHRSEEEVLKLVRDADAVMTDYFEWTADAIAEAQRCRVIAQYGVGVDRVDLDAARAAGLTVTNTPAYCVDELADHALALLLAVSRKIVMFDRAVRDGVWDYNRGPEMRRLRSRTLGLVGAGRIGVALAERARALGLHVIGYDPGRTADDLAADGIEAYEFERLLEESDIVSLHLPHTAATHHILNRDRLAMMKSDAILINTARGRLVDEAELAKVLASGRLNGAGLDVLEREPPAPDNPLMTLENVVITPHAGFLSRESMLDVQTQAAEEVARVLEGKAPRHIVVAPGDTRRE